MKPNVLIPIVLLAGQVAWAAVPADFAQVRDVSGPAGRAPALAEIRLDAAVFAATRAGFSDLRLFDGDFREIPFLVEPLVEPRERGVRRPVAARVGEIRELSGNRFEVRCDLDPDAPAANAVEIRTPLRDFIRAVRIVGSADNQFWQPLAESLIYDYSRLLEFRRTLVPLPANECRAFQIEIAAVPPERAEPFVRLVAADGQKAARAEEMRLNSFQVGGIGFWQTAVEPSVEPVLREWPPAGVETSRDLAARTTEFILDARRAPLTQVEFASPVRDFNRLVTVLVPGGERWRPVADGVVSRISVPEFATNAMVVRFPEQRADRLRVVVQHANASAVKFSGIRAYGPDYRLVWIAAPGARYQLACGNALVEAAGYDDAPIRAALANGNVPEPWQLAPPPIDPSAPAPGTGRLYSRYLPGGILLGLSAVAWFFFARARKNAAAARASR
ncbi:MAG TPA: DUF3999 family protein [Kiritimatiellia bacterium]|nr:DUF3999 family protein [Kiritimatiellia bacterium]